MSRSLQQSPKITHISWGRIDVEGIGTDRTKKGTRPAL